MRRRRAAAPEETPSPHTSRNSTLVGQVQPEAQRRRGQGAGQRRLARLEREHGNTDPPLLEGFGGRRADSRDEHALHLAGAQRPQEFGGGDLRAGSGADPDAAVTAHR